MVAAMGIRLLMLVRYFPPSGGSGVQRLARLARYLPDHGVDVDVVTTDLVADGASLDPELARELPSGVRVVRVEDVPSIRMRATVSAMHAGFAFYRGLRLFGVPDPELVDVPAMIRAARSLPRPDVILASSPPFSNLLGAAYLASRISVPWIADLRDPWSHHPWFRAMTPLHLHGLHALEATVLQRASRVVIVAEEMRRFVPEANSDRIAIIENGFDPQDLRFFERTRAPRSNGAPFRLVYVGTLQRGIRLEMLRELPEGFLLEIYGRCLTDPPPGARVHGYVTHKEAMEAMAGADALVLDLPQEMAFAPASKLYEYLIAGPPVLAIVPPEGAAAERIRRLKGGLIVPPGDRRALGDALDRLRRGDVELSSLADRMSALQSVRRDVQAGALADLVRSVAR
jgi:glycosyltransferase involved in cell wall biosynthesis